MIRSGVHAYHVGPWRRWALCYAFGPILGLLLFLAATSEWEEARGLLISVGIVLAIALPFQFLIDRTRLEVSRDGVSLRQFGYRLDAPWENIVGLRVDPGREGFITRDPIRGSGAIVLKKVRRMWADGAPFYDEEQQQLLGERRLIPIDAFRWHLRRQPLRRDLQLYAPHLAALLPPPKG